MESYINILDEPYFLKLNDHHAFYILLKFSFIRTWRIRKFWLCAKSYDKLLYYCRTLGRTFRFNSNHFKYKWSLPSDSEALYFIQFFRESLVYILRLLVWYICVPMNRKDKRNRLSWVFYIRNSYSHQFSLLLVIFLISLGEQLLICLNILTDFNNCILTGYH